MDQPEQRFVRNTRVRLREGVDPGFYNGFSRAGQQGWVRKRKRDRYGFPQVFIEWDKDHWAYNQQPDIWTWEGHFEAVEGSMSKQEGSDNSERDKQIHQLTETFLKSLFSAIDGGKAVAAVEAEEAADETDEEKVDPRADLDPEDWDQVAADAARVVQQSPAYIVIALEERDVGKENPMIFPCIYHKARTDEYSYICRSHLAHLTAALQDDLIGNALQKTQESEDE